MESLQVVLLDLEKSVQCVICLGSLKNPVTTRCNHNFCNDCIRKVLKNKPEIPCPLCKKIVRLRSLKKATHLGALINAVHKVTNQVQKCADIPYTLSQSTREGPLQPVIHSSHSENEQTVLNATTETRNSNALDCNDNTFQTGEDTIAINNQTLHGTVSNTTKNFNTEETVERNIFSEIQCIRESLPDVPHNNSSTEKNLGNIVTVSVDVHHSPIDSQALLNKTKTNSSKTNATNSMQRIPTIKLIQNNLDTNVINGCAITSNTNDSFEQIQDPFAFPLSQNSKTREAKTKTMKKAPKKVQKNVSGKKRKSPASEDKQSMKKKQKICETSLTMMSSKNEKFPQNQKKTLGVREIDIAEAAKAVNMIKEVENHKLTVEKVQESTIQDERLRNQQSTSGVKSQTKNQIESNVGMEERLKKKTPNLVRRLLSESSSSSDSEMEQERRKAVLPRNTQSEQTVNDKVSDWLETTTASTMCSSVHSSPSTQNGGQTRTETLTSDDELLSHSQVSYERIPDRVLLIKRRKFSPTKFDPEVQKSVKNQLWNREKAVFGDRKPRNTFLSKNRKNLFSLWPHENSTSSEDGKQLKKTSKTKHEKKSRNKQSWAEKIVYIDAKERKNTNKNKIKSPNKESIFDVQGLSQNISPFKTPTKNSDPKSPEKVYVLVTPLADDIVTVKSPKKHNLLKEFVDEIPTNRPSENYNVEDVENSIQEAANNEKVAKELTEGFLQDLTEKCALEASEAFQDSVVDNLPELKIRSTKDHVKPRTEPEKVDESEKNQEDNLIKMPAHSSSPSSQWGKKVKKTPNRSSVRSDLPLVGDSPTTQSSVKSNERQSSIVSVPQVELGLLDFSEAMVLSPKSAKKVSVERPEVVAKTCRMVLKSLGEIASVNNNPANTTQQESKSTTRSSANPGLLETKSTSEKQTLGYETDDSMIPPSTSSTLIAVPTTPPPCHLTRATYQLATNGNDSIDETLSISGKIIEEKVVVQKTYVVDDSQIEKRKMINQGDFFNENDVASDMDNDGIMQCLSNGWGGTKLKIFKSASSSEISDSNSNDGLSVRKQRKKILHKGASGSNIFASGVDGNILHKNQQLNSDIIVLSDDIMRKEPNAENFSKTDVKLTTYSVDIIPNSDNMVEANISTPTVSGIRKSTRKNKGRHSSFDFVTTTPTKNKKEKGSNPMPDSTNEKPNSKTGFVDGAHSALKTSKMNPVLKHIEAAIAHADTSYINWTKDGALPGSSVTSHQGDGKTLLPQSHSPTGPTKQYQTKEKVKKVPSPKKSLVVRKIHIPMGKRTKKNIAVLENRKTSSADELKHQQSYYSSDDEYFSRSWPYENRNHETFSCSLPNAVPKHITNVSVKLERITQSQPSKFDGDGIPAVKLPVDDETSLRKLSEVHEVNFDDDDVIEPSPMMFETQDNEIRRVIEEKNTIGRSVNIDLREMNESESVRPNEVDFIHDNEDFDEDNETDDVICCSWNEEVDNKVGSKSVSCHEDASSINSSEQQMTQETKLECVNLEQKTEKVKDVGVAEGYYKIVNDTLNDMCNLNKELVLQKFPLSSRILFEAIGICNKAKLSLDSEISSSNHEKLTVKDPRDDISTVKSSSGHAPMKRKRGRPRKKSSSAPVPKSSPQEDNQISKAKNSQQMKKTVNRKEQVLGTEFKTETNVAVTTTKPDVTTNVDQEWVFDDEEMAMFDEIDDVLEIDTRVPDGSSTNRSKVYSKIDQATTSKEKNGENLEQDFLSKSLENAMLETEIGNSEPHKTEEIVGEGMELEDNINYMDDTVDPSQNNSEKDDIIPSSPNPEDSDVVADKVDEWLRRLSDLNKKEGDKQKRKIGDKWTRLSDENASVSPNNPAELLRKLDHEAAMAKGNLPEKLNNESPNSITKFMNELDQDSNKSDSTTSKLNQTEKCAQSRRLSFEEGELQEWIDSAKKSPDKNDPEKVPISFKNTEHDSQPMNSDVPESQLCETSQFAESSSNTKHEQPSEIVSQSKSSFIINNANSQNHGLNFIKSSQDSIKYCDNMFNTKVILKKVDIPIHREEIAADSSPSRDLAFVKRRVNPKVERWLEASQPEAASPPTFESPVKEKFGYVSSGLQEKGVNLVKMFAKKHDSKFYPKFDKDNVTHVIVRASEHRSCDRTLKYLQGIAAKKWVVSVKWISASFDHGAKLPEEEFEIQGDNCMKEFEHPQGPKRSRTSPDGFKLLEKYRCVCMPPFSLITTEQAKELLQMCGATVAEHLGDLISDPKHNLLPEKQRVIIIDVETLNSPDYIAMASQFGAAVVSLEWMYESISRFEVQPLSEYTVTDFTQDSEITANGD